MNEKDSNTTDSAAVVQHPVGEADRPDLPALTSEVAPVDVESVEEREVESSKAAPVEGAVDKTWSDGRTPTRTCSAHRSNGQPCRRAAINGGTVCATHGGRSPQVKRAARVRLEMAADRMAKELLGIASADDAPPAVKLAAIRDALDRAGLGAKTAVEVEVGLKPFEELLTGMTMGSGSRAASRERRGEADDRQPDWLRDELEDAIDAEVVEDEPEAARPSTPWPTEPPASPAPASGLMDYEDALEQLRATSPPPAPQAQRRNRHKQ